MHELVASNHVAGYTQFCCILYTKYNDTRQSLETVVLIDILTLNLQITIK